MNNNNPYIAVLTYSSSVVVQLGDMYSQSWGETSSEIGSIKVLIGAVPSFCSYLLRIFGEALITQRHRALFTYLVESSKATHL